MQGSLFTQEFLERGIRETDAWQTLDDDAVAAFTDAITRIFRDFPVDTRANEAVTEQELIFPVLEALGWADYLPQQSTSKRGRVDVPDALLFPDNGAKTAAQAERRDDHRYRHGIAVLESKRWQRALDRASHGEDIDKTTPSTQILRYLSRAEVASERAIRWGILTNGRHWRLYWQGARSRSEQFLELDLAALAEVGETQGELFLPEAKNPEHFLRVFLLLFGRGAFLPQADDLADRSFHLIALEEGRHWEALVSEELGGVVFSKIFPGLIRALVDHDPQRPDPLNADYLGAVRADALLLLYRLLFCLYAEDRNLLPARDTRYDDYALRAIREDIATRRDANDVFSGTATRYWDHLANLFHMIDVGDTSIGLPPYNGGLFTGHRQHVINRARVPDSKLAPLIDILSRWKRGDKLHWINYRDLSVQQLGAIYERLLEYAAVPDEADGFVVRPNIFARRVSGSYYTHDALVRLIIKRSVGPLIDERRAVFSETAKALASKRKSKTDRLRELSRHDAAAEILKLKICDPAMGSGHFLVSLVDYLADEILQAMADAEAEVTWADEDAPYQSPVARRIERIRGNILASAAEHDWNLREEQLDDRQIVRRLILKRVIFGVDKNPMAVELAKLALWLHTFTVGAPLSFLDHHLRYGDSLFGERLQPMLAELREFGALFQMRELTRIGAAAKGMNDLAELTDTDIAEVRQSQVLFEEVERELKPLHAVLALWHAFRWLEPERGDETTKAAYADLLSGNYGDLFALAQGTDITAEEEKDRQRAQAVADLLATARELIAEQHFFAWELAFPTVWRDLAEGVPTGGFDVIIGNPPWDRIKLQQVEWFAERAPEIARAARAADRKRMIERLQKNDDPLYSQYEVAQHRAEAGARVARKSGYYPLLSKGDTNLYSLFVERAAALIKSTGIVGLLTPSGIASDKGAAAFFQSIATTGRLAALLDFENKRTFFPDVDSRFKFCACVFGGEQRHFEQTECAFFLHRIEELDEPERAFVLSAADFDAVNPNTGTAPIFRSRRDADITAGIYQRLPVLVDRRTEPPTKLWPVRYTTMFHMTNDSHLFKRRDELEAEGFYPVAGNRWKKAETEYVPLYEGKMVQAYDHRAASVVVNPDNVHRPAQPRPATPVEHADPDWLPDPQYWINKEETHETGGLGWVIGYKEITAPTNVRTMIASVFPAVGFGNKVPILRPESSENTNTYKKIAPLIVANLNSFVLDFVARQKLHGQTLNLYIIEQLPLVPPARFEDTIGNQTIGDFVRGEVLRLTYTAEDMRPFAADMGYDGAPFVWDDEDRRHHMARLDALFFTLYGLNRDDASYVLDQFPIIRQADEKTFGHFRTKEMILAYMNAVVAGDLQTKIQA